MIFRRSITLSLILLAGIALSAAAAQGQDDAPHRGRKYKAPPVTSHIEVTVVKASNHKPIVNAAVVFHPMKDGKDDGNLEVKTDSDGKAVIDVIPTGSDFRVQVIASGLATFGEDYHVDEPSKTIEISMLSPRAQVSAYTDNHGKPVQMKPGVQEPRSPALLAPTPSTGQFPQH